MTETTNDNAAQAAPEPVVQASEVPPEPQFVLSCDPFTLSVSQAALILNLLGIVISATQYKGLPPTLKGLFRSV